MIPPKQPFSSEDSDSKMDSPKQTSVGDKRYTDAFFGMQEHSKSPETKNVEKATVFDKEMARKFIDEAQKMPAFMPLITSKTAEKYLRGEPNGTYLMFTEDIPTVKFTKDSIGLEKSSINLHIFTIQQGKIKDFNFGGNLDFPNSLKDFLARPENKEAFRTPYNPIERLLNYKENTSGAKAVGLLSGSPAGTYLVRDSSDPKFVAALSRVNNKGDIEHFRLSEQGKKFFFEGETREEQKFTSIEDLILNNRETFSNPFKEKPASIASRRYQQFFDNQEIMPGYVPQISAVQAEIRLTGKQPGTYIIRDSSDASVFKSATVVKNNGAVEHYRVINQNGKFFFQGAKEDEKASTFDALIANNRNTFSKPYSA